MKGIIDSFLKFIKENSVTKTVLMILTMLLAAVIFVFWVFRDNAKEAFEKSMSEKDKKEEVEHRQGLARRVENNKIINDKLDIILFENGLDCTFIIEGHNGGVNMKGLPFAKFTMTYERLNKGVEPISDEFDQQMLSKYSILDELQQDGFVFTTVCNLSDNRIKRIMEKYGYKTLYIRSIYDDDNISGVFGFFDKEELTEHDLIQVQKTLVKHMHVFSKLISKKIDK